MIRYKNISLKIEEYAVFRDVSSVIDNYGKLNIHQLDKFGWNVRKYKRIIYILIDYGLLLESKDYILVKDKELLGGMKKISLEIKIIPSLVARIIKNSGCTEEDIRRRMTMLLKKEFSEELG